MTDNLYFGTEKSIVEKFNCLICFNLVKKPVKFRYCCEMYCKKCIEDALQININRCPHCLKSPFNNDIIDLILKNILDESEFMSFKFTANLLYIVNKTNIRKNAHLPIDFLNATYVKLKWGLIIKKFIKKNVQF